MSPDLYRTLIGHLNNYCDHTSQLESIIRRLNNELLNAEKPYPAMRSGIIYLNRHGNINDFMRAMYTSVLEFCSRSEGLDGFQDDLRRFLATFREASGLNRIRHDTDKSDLYSGDSI